MNRTSVIALVTLIALTAAACSDDKTPKTPKKAQPTFTQPKAGQCVAEEVPDGEDVAPNTETVVPCSKPHVYEIVAVIDIPKRFLTGKTKAQKLARRSELADVGDKPTKLRQSYSNAVYSKCDTPFREASGLAALTVKGKSAKKVSLGMPFGGTSQWYTVTSPKLWLAGTTQAVCSIRFSVVPKGDKRPPVLPVRSKSSKQVIASYLTKDFPVEVRGCIEPRTEDGVSCAKPHSEELLWVMDMKAVYDKDFLSGADLTNVNADQLAKIRAACADPLKQIGNVLGDAERMDFRFYPKIPTTKAALPIVCSQSTGRPRF